MIVICLRRFNSFICIAQIANSGIKNALIAIHGFISCIHTILRCPQGVLQGTICFNKAIQICIGRHKNGGTQCRLPRKCLDTIGFLFRLLEFAFSIGDSCHQSVEARIERFLLCFRSIERIAGIAHLACRVTLKRKRSIVHLLEAYQSTFCCIQIGLSLQGLCTQLVIRALLLSGIFNCLIIVCRCCIFLSQGVIGCCFGCCRSCLEIVSSLHQDVFVVEFSLSIRYSRTSVLVLFACVDIFSRLVGCYDLININREIAVKLYMIVERIKCLSQGFCLSVVVPWHHGHTVFYTNCPVACCFIEIIFCCSVITQRGIISRLCISKLR